MTKGTTCWFVPLLLIAVEISLTEIEATMSSSSVPRSMRAALNHAGQFKTASMSAPRYARAAYPPSSCSCYASSSTSHSFSTSALRSTQHNSEESPARTHRKPLPRDNREDFSATPKDNITREKDQGFEEYSNTLNNAEVRGATGQTPQFGAAAADDAAVNAAAVDASQSSVSQASAEIADQADANFHTPQSQVFPAKLQPDGYGYTPQTLPTKVQPTLELLINMVMKDGKKATAQKQVLGAVKYLSEALNTDPLPAIKEALTLASPLVRFKRLYLGGGKIVQCPVPLAEKAGLRKAVANLIFVAERRTEPRFEMRLAREILAILEGNSGVLKKKEEIHKEGIRHRGNLNLPPSALK
ncbi:unnamed protein product [Sympodiomycopsis kandeliae]